MTMSERNLSGYPPFSAIRYHSLFLTVGDMKASRKWTQLFAFLTVMYGVVG